MLTISGIDQYYGGSHTLRHIGMEIPAGACTAVLGRNGVGKTTLLKCLMGVLPVAAGTIRFNGHDITRAAPHTRAHLGMAYVPQGREIFPRLTVEENIRVAEAAIGVGSSARAQAYELFPVLKEMRHRRGGDLSGGQQQQLAIARALVATPKLLILDEPTEGIQPSIIKYIEQVIHALKERKITVLLVEQYFDFAKVLADRYYVLARGEVVKQGAGSDMQVAADFKAHLAL